MRTPAILRDGVTFCNLATNIALTALFYYCIVASYHVSPCRISLLRGQFARTIHAGERVIATNSAAASHLCGMVAAVAESSHV